MFCVLSVLQRPIVGCPSLKIGVRLPALMTILKRHIAAESASSRTAN